MDNWQQRDNYRRAMEDHERYNRRHNDDDEDVLEFFIKAALVIAIIAFIGTIAAYFGAGYLDSWFGWELEAWLQETLPWGNPLD